MKRGGRISYDELRRQHELLKVKYAELERAMKQADRSLVRYRPAESWVAVPLPSVLENAIIDKLKEIFNYSHRGWPFQPEEGRELANGRREAIFEDWDEKLSVQYRHYVIRYNYDPQADGEAVTDWKVCGLVPV